MNKDLQQVQVYRRDKAVLMLVQTLQASDAISSPLLPEFSCPLQQIFR